MGFKHSLHVNTLSEKGYCDSGIALAGHSIGMVLLKKIVTAIRILFVGKSKLFDYFVERLNNLKIFLSCV